LRKHFASVASPGNIGSNQVKRYVAHLGRYAAMQLVSVNAVVACGHTGYGRVVAQCIRQYQYNFAQVRTSPDEIKALVFGNKFPGSQFLILLIP
jgi:hypothetical protein